MVFKSIGDSLPGSVATWAFSGRARHGTQDHPVNIPRAVRCPVRYLTVEHLFLRSGRVVQDRPSPSVRWADVLHLSAVVQWLGSSIGSSYGLLIARRCLLGVLAFGFHGSLGYRFR